MRLRLSKLRVRPAFGMSLLRVAKPLRVLSTRPMSSAGPAKVSDEEKQKLIKGFPYEWPWGQTIEVKTPRHTLKIKIPQDAPAPKQHKLAYKVDAAPVEVPTAPAFFVGPIGKATHELFNTALAAGTLDQTKAAIDNFVTEYEKLEVRNALMNPRTMMEDKYAYVREVATGAGADEATAEVLVGLFKSKRLRKVAELRKNFGILVMEHRKEKHGSIISAEPLTEKQYDAIAAKMQALLQPDEKLVLTREVEPAVVGGFIIRIGNRAQDLSVATQISRMEKHLKDFFATNSAAADKVIAN